MFDLFRTEISITAVANILNWQLSIKDPPQKMALKVDQGCCCINFTLNAAIVVQV